MKCFGQKIRNYHCKVVLLDDQELIQEIQSTSLGQELLETIFKHLNIIETSYFGLRFIDTTEQTHWLDPGKKTAKQLEDTETFTLYFGVKFYAADPCKLVEEITRYQFFLQIKQDILQGRLPVPNELSPELCAYAVQSELGDYDPRRHGVGYISEFQFTSNQSPEMELKIADLHKSLIGQVPAVAELNYLEKVKWLEMYGVDLHPVMGEDNTDYFLGLTPAGVIVLRNKTKVGNYFWPRISKLNQKGKYFMLRVKNKNNEEQTYGFETPSKAACKHMWRCATEHFAFFRLVQVTPSSKSHSLNTWFRDSARSETSIRRRAQPQFVRTPSRKYQRRIVEGAQDDSEFKANNLEITNSKSFKRTVAVLQPVDGCHQSSGLSTANHRTESPRSTRSAPWTAASKGKLNQASVPSPKSVRSAGVGSSHISKSEQSHERRQHRSRNRSASGESNSSCDSQSRRRHRHRRRSRRGSDAESEASRQSGRSHGKRRHHKSGSRSRCGESENSEPENCTRKHRHHHRKSESKKYELVDSEAQWKEVQMKQSKMAVQQAAVVQSLGSPQSALPVTSTSRNQTITATPSRKSAYGNEAGSEASSSQNRRRHRRTSHRSSSPDKRLPTELKRHLDFQLIDTEGMTEEQRREIPYHRIETSQEKTIKAGRIRHSSSLKSTRTHTTQSIISNGNTEDRRQDGKALAMALCGSDSPPPPYSPPPSTNQKLIKPPIPQKPVISRLGPSLGTEMTVPKEFENRASSYGKSLPRNVSLERSEALGQSTQPRFNSPQPQPQCPSNHFSGQGQVKCVEPKHGPNHHELGLPTSFHPSPSESPDSQKHSHHENSDSGLGTDHHEYYKSENFSSLGYDLSPRIQPGNGNGLKNTTVMNPEFEFTRPLPQNVSNVANKMHSYQKSPSNYWSNVSQAEPQRRQTLEINKGSDISGSSLRPATTDNQQQKLAHFLQQQPKITTHHEISTEL